MAKITSIQKYSIHDGDGIRTTVFFKGCPLRCVWCHNPETQHYEKEVLHDKEKCVGCKSCEKACPQGAISSCEDKAATDVEKCTLCGNCLDYCLLNLREITGTEYSIEEIVHEVKKDEMFYEQSGGGVTLSGGEVMTMNVDFLESLVKEFDRQGIDVTIDTSGYCSYENFQRIQKYVDTFLYDVKAMDPETHLEYVGVDNQLILENLKKLSADGNRIYLRIPVIKEVNGTKEAMDAVIEYINENRISIAQVNLLPYHNIGVGKYEKIGQEYQGKTLSAPSNEEMNEFVSLFQKHGFQKVKIGG